MFFFLCVNFKALFPSEVQDFFFCFGRLVGLVFGFFFPSRSVLETEADETSKKNFS